MDYIFIQRLTIQPIIANLTFKMSESQNNSRACLLGLKNAAGKAVASFDHTPVKVKGISLSSVYGTKDQIMGNHGLTDTQSLAKEVVMGLIFSSKIIGNPAKFFNKMSKGFNDLVDKPAQGFNQGPIEGGIGIIKGAGSLTAKTFGATFNSVHCIADSLATGLTTLTGVYST